MKVIKFFVFLGIFACLLIVACVTLLPTVFSSNFGKEKILRKINDSIMGSLSVRKLSLGWFSGQKLEGVILQDPQGKKIVSIDQFETDSSLLNLLWTKNISGKTSVKGANTTLARGENGFTNVEYAVSTKTAPQRPEGHLTSIQLEDVNADYDPKGKVVNAAGNTKYKDNVGSFTVDGSLQSPIHLVVNAKNFPVELLDHLIGLQDPKWKGTIIDLLGDTADLKIDHVADKAQSQLAIDIKSPLINGALQGELTEQQITVQTKSPLNFSVSPELYDQVLRNLDIKKVLPRLRAVTQGSLNLERCSIPFGANKELKILSSDVKGSIQLGNTSIELPQKKDPIEFSQLSTDFETPKNTDKVFLHVFGKGIQKGAPMEVDVQLTLPKALITSSPAPKVESGIQASCNLKGFPTELIEKLSGYNGQLQNKLQAAFGPKMDIIAQGALQDKNGSLKGTFKGAQGFASVDGRLQEGVLYLNQPLQTEFTVSPEFSTEILEPFIPLLGSAMSADQPLKVTIAKENFSFPLMPYLPMNASIGNATLDLGKMYFNKDGELASALSLLKVKTSDTISVWFTPIYANFVGQVLNLQRFDMLVANNYPMASWGKVDFGNDKLRMIIGLSGQALSKAFGLPTLDPSSMMQIPIRGTPSSPKLDKSKVATKLSSIAAMAAGPQGLVLGAIINLISSINEEPTPEPTTQPFPWGTLPTESSTDESKKEQPKVLKDVQKGVKEVLKKVLPF